MSAKIQFCGAAGVVTGSCYLVTVPEGKFLVDCGLFQGTKTVKELNYRNFPFNPAEIDFVLLTHAHIDHSGLLPKLCKDGFQGKIFTTRATADLLKYMLPDSGHIQESEVMRLNQRNRQRGQEMVEPIYTQQDAFDCLERIQGIEPDGWIDLPLGVRCRLWNAGHILGSVSIEAELPNGETPVSVLFSGDIGPDEKSFHPDPQAPHDIDYLLVESTYGGRERADASPAARRKILKQEILDGLKASGNILMPAFAVERTQELLCDLDYLMEKGDIPATPIFLDSPLATSVTGVFEKYAHELEGINELDTPFRGKHIKFVESVEESKGLNNISSGAIIMAASGMCDAGRIRHHLKNNLWNPSATVLLTGYQAEGSLGRLIESGVRKVRIHGQEIDVRARIRKIDVYSAHADQAELVAWVKKRMPVKKGIFLTHGEDPARHAFMNELVNAGVPQNLLYMPLIDEIFTLDKALDKPDRYLPESPRLHEEEMSPTDWHNAYAKFVLELSEELRQAPNAKSRYRLLEELEQVIEKSHQNKKKKSA